MAMGEPWAGTTIGREGLRVTQAGHLAEELETLDMSAAELTKDRRADESRHAILNGTRAIETLLVTTNNLHV